ncbi:MAG: hypothetical protein AAF467_18615 [Actinomycetota bacterium]
MAIVISFSFDDGGLRLAVLGSVSEVGTQVGKPGHPGDGSVLSPVFSARSEI